MESKRCYGCMKAKQQSPICEHCGYDERIQNAPHQLPAGTVLQGKYLLGRVLGQGGFGITYLGRDIKLDTTVAIKEYYPTGMVARESGIDPTVTVVTGGEDTRFAENRDRFLREARTLARLEDVGEVVQVKNFFEENNTAYIVMGYVRGITLKEHMRRSGGKLSAEEVFRLLEPLMEALQQVHELGLVHRDISPDNIILQPNKRARLIDFGAAHAATADGDKSTQAVLKHGFAPPEQYQSKGHLGPWTDVYAMCATIYHLLSGLQPPNITDLLMGEADFQWSALDGLTPEQLTALKQGLATQYKQRIQSMEELCRRLFAEEAQTVLSAAQPTAQPQRTARPEPENPTVSATGTIALTRNDTPTLHTTHLTREPAVFTAPVVPEKGDKKPKKRGFGLGVILAAAGVLAIAVLAAIFALPDTPANQVPAADHASVSTQPLTAQPDSPQSTVNTAEAAGTFGVSGGRTLQSRQTIYKDTTDGVNTWQEFDEDANYAFGTRALCREVATVTFLDTTKDAPTNAVDASQERDASVLAWVVPNGELYDLYLAADGKINAPESCDAMFQYYTNVTEINFNGLLVTDNVISTFAMFDCCFKLEKVDLTSFDTRNVINMYAMFAQCFCLRELDLSRFDTGSVTDMGAMFYHCESLEQLDLSSFNTGNVTSMCNMFQGCKSLKRLDLSGFNTENVTNMAEMFEYCAELVELDISGFNTENVTVMAYMFRGTDRLQAVYADFDVRKARTHEFFMDSGDTFNGKAWEELFW